MIVARLENIISIFNRNSAMGALCDYLQNATREDSEIGARIVALQTQSRIEKSFDLGFGMRAIEQSYACGGEIKLESHKKYVDFQLIVRGDECMQICDISDAQPLCAYDESRDVIFYKPNNKTSNLILNQNMLAILFPSDIHAGGARASSDFVFKTVIKVPLNLLEIRL